MSIKYSDSGFLDGADSTKKLSFDVSGVTTGTTRTITMPDANVDLSSVGTPDDNSVTLAKMAGGTDGNLITYDASGDPAYVTTGTSGQILTSNGAGVAPTFQAAAGGGKVLQVVQGTTTTEVSTTTSTWIDSGLTASITPSSTSSKILVIFSTVLRAGMGSDNQGGVRLVRGSTTIQDYGISTFGMYEASSNTLMYGSFSANYLDSPATTSATTYKYQGRNYSTGTFYMNSNSGSSSDASIILMEIGA